MKVAIVGGGAAGMMAAAALAEAGGVEVFVIEKNAVLGRKVVISGGGRCNTTTGLRDVRKVLECYPRGGKFLNSAMNNFPPEKVYEWFESQGVPLKVEKDLRVFPVSNDGHDIVGVFERIFSERGVNVLLRHSVESIEHLNNKFVLKFKDGLQIDFDAVVLTTGGQAYRFTGSSGEGYAFAEALGHTITKLAPSLNSFITEEQWPKNLAGVSIPKATFRSGKAKYTGPFIFTHKGVSGPAVFALSSLVAFEDYGKNKPLEVFIDLIPDTGFGEFEKEFLAEVAENPKKNFSNSASEFMPKSLAKEALINLGIEDKKNAEVSKKDLNRMVFWIKNVPLKVVERGAGDEFVTAGGVELKEVDSKTMESKICPGLYFAGEILDIDGFTGGFNLQASWATGRLAGESIIQTSRSQV